MSDEIDALRTRLNQAIDAGKSAEAVKLARRLRKALLSKPSLDERERKSLDGATLLIRRFNEEAQPKLTRTGLIIALLALAMGILVYLLLRP